MFEPMEDVREAFHAAFLQLMKIRFQPAADSPEEAAIITIFTSGIPFNCWDLEEGPQDPPRWEGDEAWDRWKDRFMEVAKAIKEEWSKHGAFDPNYENSNHDYCWRAVEQMRQMRV